MITVQETTFKEPQYNHTYVLSDDKFHVHGYTPSGTDEVVMFKVPMKFNPRGRTFSKVKEVK